MNFAVSIDPVRQEIAAARALVAVALRQGRTDRASALATLDRADIHVRAAVEASHG